MSDRREAILVRIYKILQGIKEFKTVARNLDELPESSRPCAVLIDGDEVRSDTSEGRGRQVVVMNMTPVISIGVSSSPDAIGAEANAIRAKVLPAILGDTTLLGLLSKESRGRILYEGVSGRLSHGSLMASDIQLNFSIFYLLNPDDLS